MSNPDEIFDIVKRDKRKLDSVFYGNLNLMSNFNTFYNLLKKKYPEIKSDVAKFYYENQEITQVFKPPVKQKIFNHIVAFYPFERMYFDTMYLKLENSTLAFNNIVDLFSKYAFSRVYTLPKSSQAIKSSQSLQTLKDFLYEIHTKFDIDLNKLGLLTLDAGSEFKGKVLEYLNENKYIYSYANPGDKRKMSPIERFNKTLRLYLEKYRVIYGRITNSVLTKILNAYNNVPHANLKYTPIEIIMDKTAQQQVEEHFILWEQENNLEKFIVGQPVRIKLPTNPFTKTKAVWSDEVYKIIKVVNNSYELDKVHGLYFTDELQPISEEYLMTYKGA